MGRRSCAGDRCGAGRGGGMSVCDALPPLRGTAEHQGSLADFIWFRTGGPAEWLVRPENTHDLAVFMAGLDPDPPVLPVGVGSNLIVRDGGGPGVEIGRASWRERVCQYV